MNGKPDLENPDLHDCASHELLTEILDQDVKLEHEYALLLDSGAFARDCHVQSA